MDDGPDRILRIRTVLERTGLRRSTLYRKIERGAFPKQVPISERGVGWRESAVERWMANPIFYSEPGQA
jgi:prophage regulatory protein